MRRREKFVITSVFLSFCLLGVQFTPLEWRYLAVALFTLIAYLLSAWALSDDLEFYEWFTILPMPALFSASVSLFYFLLPTHFLSQVLIFVMFAVGMYAIFLTANIFSVAKGRTIQLLYAAHAIGLFFTLLVSMLLTNTIFGLKLPFWLTSILISLVHFPLSLTSLWSVRLENYISKEIIQYSLMISIFLLEFSILLCWLPYPVWHSSLFIMSFIYIALGSLQSFLRGRFFKRTVNEYLLVSVFLIVIFFALFPFK